MFTWKRNFLILGVALVAPSLLAKDPYQKARERGQEAVRDAHRARERAMEKGREAVQDRIQESNQAREKAIRDMQREREKRGLPPAPYSSSSSSLNSWQARENQRINELNRQEQARYEAELRSLRGASERSVPYPRSQAPRQAEGVSYTIDEFGNAVPYLAPSYVPRPQPTRELNYQFDGEEDVRPVRADNSFPRTTIPRPPGEGWNEVHDGRGGRTTRYGDHVIHDWMQWFRITENGLEHEPREMPLTGLKARFQKRADYWKSRTAQWEQTASADFFRWANSEQVKLANETRPLISGAVTREWQSQLSPYSSFWNSARTEFAGIAGLWASLMTESDAVSSEPQGQKKLLEKEAIAEKESESRFAKVVAGWEQRREKAPALQDGWKNLLALNDIVAEKTKEFAEHQKLIDQTVTAYQKDHEKWWTVWHDDKYVVTNQEWLARKEKEGKALTLETREVIRATVKEKWEKAHEEVSGALSRMGRGLQQEALDQSDFLKSVPVKVKEWFLAGKKLPQVKESLLQLTQEEDTRRSKARAAIESIWTGADPKAPLLDNPWKKLVGVADLLMETSDTYTGFKKLVDETTKKYQTDHEKWWTEWNDDKYTVRSSEWQTRKEKESRTLAADLREHVRVPAKKKWELAQQEITGALARMGRGLQQEDLDQAEFLKKVAETVREKFLAGKKLPEVTAAILALTEAEDKRRAKARASIEGIWIGPDRENPFFDKQWARTVSAAELLELEAKPLTAAIGKTNFQLRKELDGPTVKDSFAFVTDAAMKTSVTLFEWEGRKSFHSVGNEAVFIVESARLLNAKVKDERVAGLAKAMETKNARGWAIWVNKDEIVDIIQPFAKTVQHLKVRSDEANQHFLIFEGDEEKAYADVLGFELSILKLETKRVPFSKYKLPTDKEFWETVSP